MTTNLEVPTSTTYGLVSGWLEPQGVTHTVAVGNNVYETSGAFVGIYGNTAAGYFYTNWQPYTGYWWCYPTADHRPIKLGLSEVEKLRSAAKRDAKLKKILEKFTDQIEVVVDFK